MVNPLNNGSHPSSSITTKSSNTKSNIVNGFLKTAHTKLTTVLGQKSIIVKQENAQSIQLTEEQINIKKNLTSLLKITFQQPKNPPQDIFDSLPKELCLIIFSNLPKNDLYKICYVSKKWYFLASDRALWEPIAKETTFIAKKWDELRKMACTVVDEKQVTEKQLYLAIAHSWAKKAK